MSESTACPELAILISKWKVELSSARRTCHFFGKLRLSLWRDGGWLRHVVVGAGFEDALWRCCWRLKKGCRRTACGFVRKMRYLTCCVQNLKPSSYEIWGIWPLSIQVSWPEVDSHVLFFLHHNNRKYSKDLKYKESLSEATCFIVWKKSPETKLAKKL